MFERSIVNEHTYSEFQVSQEPFQDIVQSAKTTGEHAGSTIPPISFVLNNKATLPLPLIWRRYMIMCVSDSSLAV